MTKLFLIPRQKTNWIETWKQVCPNCTSIEELSTNTEYDLTIADRGYRDETIYGFDYSNGRPVSEETKNICTNCGYVFELSQ